MCRQTGESKRKNNVRRSINTISRLSPSISGRTGEEKEKKLAADLPLDERAGRNYIIEGTRDGLIADLERKRAEGAAPLDIINGPLMTGMAEVGRLFNAGRVDCGRGKAANRRRP